MDVTISLPEDLALKLKERAATTGQTIPAYTEKLVAETLTKPTVDELLAPVRADFVESAMTEEQVEEFLRGELEAHRREKQAKSA